MAKDKGFSLVKWLVVLVVLAAAIGGLWYWKHPPEKPVDYKTAPVARGDVIQVVTATGQLNPVTNVQVGCQISGILNKIYVDFNSPVTNGQLIARLDPSTYQAIVAQAQGDVANAEATLELSQVETKRAEELHKASLISQSDYDKATADLHQSEANVLIKKAALQKDQVDLDRTSIYAPVDGVVISRNVDVGQTVAASLSAPTLFVIANDLSKMQIDALVSEADIGGIQTNEAVNFTVDAFPTRTFRGSVVQVRNSPQTNQNVITYDTVIGVNNADQKLKPGMTANVSIITAETNNALKIPNAALRFKPPDAPDTATNTASQGYAGARSEGGSGGQGRGGGGRAGGGSGKPHVERQNRTVYLLAAAPDGKGQIAKPVQIKTGINDGIYTQVIDGLKEGDEIIIGLALPSDTPSKSRSSSPFGGGRHF